MFKTKTFALMAAALFATASVYAGGKACCVKQTSNDGKMECSLNYADLHLTPTQKTKLDALQAQCQKEGCTKESMDKFIHSAKGVLSKAQYAQLKAQCTNMRHSEKAG